MDKKKAAQFHSQLAILLIQVSLSSFKYLIKEPQA